jgi:hypothetical protein
MDEVTIILPPGSSQLCAHPYAPLSSQGGEVRQLVVVGAAVVPQPDFDKH